MANATRCRTLRFHEFGPPSNLQLQEVPCPALGPSEALVAVKAAGINPSDVKNVQGAMAHTTLPRTPGRDYAGVVLEGPAAWVGQEVWGSGGDLGFVRDGSHADFLVVPEAALCRKPARLSFAEAAAVGVPFVTAWTCLMDAAHLRPGESVLIVGGTGAVGTAAAQIARWKGAQVLATVRQATGARGDWHGLVDDVIVLADQDMAQAAKDWTQGRGVQVVLNAVGGPTFAPGLAALAPGGRMTVITITPEMREVPLDLLDFYRRGLRLLGVNTLTLDAAAGAQVLEHLAPGFESGALQRPVVAAAYPLDQAASAYARVAAGSGKVVLTME